MLYKELLLKNVDPKLRDSNAKLRAYILERNEEVSLRPCILICPGGSYSFCSKREGEIIAFRFLSEGFNCFVLDYSTKQQYPMPHIDLMGAISYIRKHEAEFDVLPNSLSLLGFSAGGHLVASYSYLYKELSKKYAYNVKDLKPTAIVLGYPVTLMNEFGDALTIENITGNNIELKSKLNVPDHITDSYPPTFMWATKDDALVVHQNFDALYKSLIEHNVPNKCTLFESGPHGLSLANRGVYKKESLSETLRPIRDWASEASDFIFDILDKR